MQFQISRVTLTMPRQLLTLLFRVLMKGITWGRDSHGLFDYESRHLTKKTMKTNNPSQIVRRGNELELHTIENGIPPF